MVRINNKKKRKTRIAMQTKRFLGNIARIYLAIGSLSMAAVAGADEIYHEPMVFHDSYMNGGCPTDCCPTESCNSCCCNEAPTCAWGYNPPGYLKCGNNSCCDSFFDTLRFRADFLWWRASEDGLSLGSEELNNYFTVDEDVTEYTKEFRCKKPNTKYDAGFRLGLASICDNCWDIGLNWTHFHTTAHATGVSDFSTSPDTLLLFESCWEGAVGAIPDQARARWTLDMDLIDLEFGHKYYVDHCFIVRPHAGLRGVRIDQGYKVFSFANRLSGPFSIQQYESNVRAKNDFLGVGPRLGLDLEFKFGCGVSIYGQAAGGLLFGRFDTNSHEHFDDFDNGIDSDFRFKCSPHRVSRAVTDLAIGLKWDHCFEWCSRCHPVSFAITWEHHGFFNFNSFNFKKGSADPTGSSYQVTDCSSSGGDLFTQGLTVSAEIGF
jgi:hypothetical protein